MFHFQTNNKSYFHLRNGGGNSWFHLHFLSLIVQCSIFLRDLSSGVGRGEQGEQLSQGTNSWRDVKNVPKQYPRLCFCFCLCLPSKMEHPKNPLNFAILHVKLLNNFRLLCARYIRHYSCHFEMVPDSILSLSVKMTRYANGPVPSPYPGGRGTRSHTQST